MVINRETGQITANVWANNYGGPFDAMPFSVTGMFFDDDGKPIGSMQTKSFRAPGVEIGTSGPRPFDANWTDYIRPASGLHGPYANRIRYSVIRISVKPEHELETKILSMVKLGTTMAEALKIFLTL